MFFAPFAVRLYLKKVGCGWGWFLVIYFLRLPHSQIPSIFPTWNTNKTVHQQVFDPNTDNLIYPIIWYSKEQQQPPRIKLSHMFSEGFCFPSLIYIIFSKHTSVLHIWMERFSVIWFDGVLFPLRIITFKIELKLFLLLLGVVVDDCRTNDWDEIW